jgi:hypothetical protein
MNDDVVETVTVNIADRRPAANILVNDHTLEIHATCCAADEQDKNDCH